MALTKRNTKGSPLSHTEMDANWDHVIDADNHVFEPYSFIAATDVQSAVEEMVDDLAASTGSSRVGFAQSGTGAVTRTVQAKARDIFSVFDFMTAAQVTAVQEYAGTSDLQSAIAAAFTAADLAANPNRTVYFPAGRYDVASGFSGKAGVNMLGDGPASTQITANNYASATGAPIYTLDTCSDWRIEGIRFEGQDKASCVLFDDSQYGVARDCMFNGYHTYGVKLIDSSQSLFDNCSWYFGQASTHVGALMQGGSMTEFRHCNFNTEGIGIKSNTTGNGSGVRVVKTTFGDNNPALSIGNGDSLWEMDGCYFEGTGGAFGNQTIISVGAFNGGGGATATNVTFKNCQVAAANNNAISFGPAGTLNFHGNEIGVNVTFTGDVEVLYESGNDYNGNTVTRSAQIIHCDQSNIKRFGTSGVGRHLVNMDATFGVLDQGLNAAETNYIKRTWIGSDFQWLIAGDTNDKMALDGSRFTFPGNFIPQPSAAQTIDAAGDQISANAMLVQLSNGTGGSITLTSAKTIEDGTDGQILRLMNVGVQDVVIQDQGTLANSNLRLAAASITLSTRDSVTLQYSSTIGDWVQVGPLVNVV